MRIAADVTLYLLALNGLMRVLGVPQGVGIWHLVTRRRPENSQPGNGA